MCDKFPDGWTRLQLGKVATLQRGFDLPIQYRQGGYGSNGIDGYHNKAAVKGPGVITGRSGSIGSVFYEDDNFWPLNTSLYVKEFHGNDHKYVARLLESLDLKNFSASTGVPSLNRNFVHPLIIYHPPVAEQQAIAAILDTMDEAIRRTEAVIAKLRQVKAGMLHDLLTRGLDENGELRDPLRHPEQFKDSPLGRIPASWDVCPLIAFATLQRGFDIIVADQSAGDIPVVSSSGITSYHNEAAVKGPGVVIGRKGKLGEAYFLNGPFWPHDTSLWVKNFHGNDEKFTALYLKFLRLERFDAATSVPTLNRNTIHPLIISIPAKTEQINIVTRLEEYEAAIQRETSVFHKLTKTKQGLIHDLLTGTIRVPPHLLETPP